MPAEIVLLTGEVEAPELGNMLKRHNRAVSVVPVFRRDDLAEACAAPCPGGRRLVSFCTSVIVPPDVLQAVDGPAYNFHPGPPTYPGSHVASFAIYDGAPMFGATAHEMAETVDSGAIVGVEWFPVPDGLRFVDLEIMAYQTLIQLFMDLAPHLAMNDQPLQRLDLDWAERVTTKQDFARMRQIDETMSEAEIKRRFRAFG